METDRRHIRRRIRDLKRELEGVRKHRRLHQHRRRKMDMIQVALVGYTNAGKSTLLNRLTGAGVKEEDRLFATLESDLPVSGSAVGGESVVDGYCRFHP